MTCDACDIKAYSLGELSGGEQERVEAHLAECLECREESERLGVTLSALRSVSLPEPSRRVAFVSDKVFEPAWYQRFWNSVPQLGFAAAAMLALAIFAHGWMTRPAAVAPLVADSASAPAVVREVAEPAKLDEAMLDARIQAAVDARLEAAVTKAVAAARQDQVQKVQTLLAEAEERFESQRKTDLLAIDDAFRYLKGQLRPLYIASARDEVMR